MLFLFLEIDIRVAVDDLAIDAQPDKPFAAGFLDNLLMLALLAAHQRRQDHHPGSLFKGQDRIDNLLDRLLSDRLAAFGTVRYANTGEKQSQVVINLRYRADRRARVFGGAFLLDRNRRRQTFDKVNIRFLHQPQKLPRIGRERLDIAPLSLGVDGIKG